MNQQPQIFIVEDDAAIVRLFENALSPLGLAIRKFESAEEFLAALQPTDFGCLLLDLGLPSMNGNELQQKLVAKGAELTVVIVSGTTDVPSIVQAFRAGAVDMIQKPFTRATVVEAVGKALAIVRTQRARNLHKLAARERIDRLSPREREVTKLLCAGKANKQVASDLGLSVRTVEVHRAHIMRKLDVSSFAEVIQLWLTAVPNIPE